MPSVMKRLACSSTASDDSQLGAVVLQQTHAAKKSPLRTPADELGAVAAGSESVVKKRPVAQISVVPHERPRLATARSGNSSASDGQQERRPRCKLCTGTRAQTGAKFNGMCRTCRTDVTKRLKRVNVKKRSGKDENLHLTDPSLY